jgi:hypothetical protein
VVRPWWLRGKSDGGATNIDASAMEKDLIVRCFYWLKVLFVKCMGFGVSFFLFGCPV